MEVGASFWILGLAFPVDFLILAEMFSVVIPLYNKSKTISRTIASVLNQTYGEFEIVVVDDGSTDGGVETLLALVDDPRLQIIRQENQGVSCARNRGVDAAQYDYIAFLDGDDEWLPGYLEKNREAIEKYPQAGMICCARYEKSCDLHGVEASSKIALAKRYREQICLVNYFENPHVFSHVSMTVVKKSVFEQAGGFLPRISYNEDFAFLYTVGLISPVVYCGFPLGVYWGGVQGQVTASLAESERTIGRYKKINHCHQKWEELNRVNSLFGVFERYETRAVLLSLLKNRDYNAIRGLIDKLDGAVLSSFPRYEFLLYAQPRLNLLAQAYIYWTKLLWRRHGFPIVGE